MKPWENLSSEPVFPEPVSPEPPALEIVCPLEKPQALPARLRDVLQSALKPLGPCTWHFQAEDVERLAGNRVLFAIALDDAGLNLEYTRMLARLRRNPRLLEGKAGGVVVDGEQEIYTKSIARELVFAANQAGCAFPGKPLVEATGSLQNFRIQARNQGVSWEQAYRLAVRELAQRLCGYAPLSYEAPRLLVLHASHFFKSNTWTFWGMVRTHLEGMEIQEISLRNGKIYDCTGCPYTMCMHFSERGSCYYGGVMVDEVYPAVERCSGLLLLCPNYNDAVSANIAAFINRLTSLFRKKPFFDKALFGIVVSGYSGGDIVASQLISALNMNKAFQLSPHFALLLTANEPGSIREIPGIEGEAADFAAHIWNCLTKGTA